MDISQTDQTILRHSRAHIDLKDMMLAEEMIRNEEIRSGCCGNRFMGPKPR